MRIHRTLVVSVLLILGYRAGIVSSVCNDPWINGTSYSKGDIVSYENHDWKAKRSTSPDDPPSSSYKPPQWQDHGCCNILGCGGPTCNDGVQNGNETGIDCGGTSCPACPTCSDGVQNGDETGIDCGGSCSPCGGSGGGSCPNDAPSGGPQVAMAWISDQFANWDVAWNMTETNQFIGCHDWILDSGINTVSLAFLKPTEILHNITDYRTSSGVRIGMSQDVVNYFKDAGMMVFFSVGGITYTDDWEEALGEDPVKLAENCAAIAEEHGVGIEIDYEESSAPMLDELEIFILRYRELIPFTNGTAESFLTIDFGQGAQFMGPTANWVAINAFNTTHPEARWLNWANAMVSGSRQSGVSDLINRWGQHVNGYSTLQTYPISPAHLIGSLWSSGRKVQDNCVNYAESSLADSDLQDYINNAQPCIAACGDCKDALPALPAGESYTKGLLGYAYWMVGNIGPRQTNTCPTDKTITVYDVEYAGDGHCTHGFSGAANNPIYNISQFGNLRPY